jgi:hypothetical protein
MPYIGNDIRSNEDYKIIDDISSGFNGSTTSFALQVGGSAPVPFPKFESQLLISVNGVVQEPDPSGSAGFRLSGTNIVFSSAPTNGHAFFGVIYAGADYVNAGGTFPDGTSAVPSITFTSDTDTGIFKSGSGLVSVASNGTKVATFPTGQGTNGQVLTTDGAGVLSYTTPSTTASVITVADESSDTTCFPIFTTAATGNLGAKSGSNLTFNSSSGLLTATAFSGSGASLTSLNASNISSGTISASRVPTLNQNTTGSAATLTTARNIGGVSFDGSANINLPGVNTSGNQNTSGTAAIATTITAGDESSDTTCFPIFSTSASGNIAPKTGSNLTFNSANGTLTATTFAGSGASITGIPAANLTGTASAINGSNITNVNAVTVDGIDSASFLRSDAADTGTGLLTLNSGISFGADARCAASVSALSDGTNIQVDFTSGVHHTVTLGGNRTFSDPNNTGDGIGQSGSIFIVQDGTGGRTAAFHADYKFAAGTAPTLSTAANAVDRLDYVIRAVNDIHCVVTLDVK